MHLHSETACPMAIGTGGASNSKAVTAGNYRNSTENATSDYAAAVVATRFRLTISTARLVCHLSGIGGGQ